MVILHVFKILQHNKTIFDSSFGSSTFNNMCSIGELMEKFPSGHLSNGVVNTLYHNHHYIHV